MPTDHGARSVFSFERPLVVRSWQRVPALRQFLGLPGKRNHLPGRSLSPTFTVSPPLLRAEAIGKCQARGLAQFSQKNQPEGLNARAEQVESILASCS